MGTLLHSVAHGLLASDTIMLANLVGGDGLAENTLYYVLAAGLTADDFAVSLTDGGAAVVFTTDVTGGSVVRNDTYSPLNDGNMYPPDPVPTPSAVTLTSAEVSGITRLRIVLNDTAEAKVRLWDVQTTHKYDSLGDPDWATPQSYSLPEGSTELSLPCLPDTQYTVRVRAVDVYGNTSAFSAETTLTTESGNDALSAALASLATDVADGIITETKIADNAISTPKLQAGAVTAEVLAATLVLASLIKTADTGRRIEIDVDGIRLFDTDESLLVRIPTNGDPVYVKGQVSADSLISETSASLRTAVSLEGNSIMTLQTGVSAPANVPTVSASVDYLTLTSTPADISTAAGIGYDSGAGTFWLAADPTQSGGYVAHEFNATTGAYVRSISATGSVSTVTAVVGSTSHVSDTAAATTGGSDSQVATPLTIPAGLTNVKASKVSAYFAGFGGSCTARVAIWSSSNVLLVSCTPFTATSRTFSAGNSDHYDKTVAAISLTAGATYRVGFERDSSSDGFQWDRDDGGGKTTYIGDGLHGDLSGITTDTSHKPNVYLTYTYDVDTRLETAPNIGVCTDGTYIYTLDTLGQVWKYDRTTLAYVANSGVQTAITGTKTQAGMFYDATAAELIITTTTGTGAGVYPKFVRVNKTTLAVSSTVYSAAAGTTFNGTTDTFRGGARVADALNASAATYWVPTTSAVYAYTFSGTTATQTSNRDFGLATTVGDGLTHDGTVFRGFDSATPTKVWKFSAWDWTTASSKYWFCYAWYDDAGTTHETAVGPRTSLTLRRHERVLVQNATIPVGGADDPNKVRIYIKPNSTDPGAGAFKLQVTDALTSRYLTDYNSAGAADGAGTAFPSGTAAELKSATTGWSLKGDGTATFKSGAQNNIRGIVAIPFNTPSLSGTVSDQPLHAVTGTGQSIFRVPFACQVVGISASLASNRTAGTLTARAYNNSAGAYVGPTVTIDGTTTNLAQASTTIGGTDIAANSQLLVKYTTSGFTPTANELTIILYVAFVAE